ncbi:hypothetical protein AP060_00018 [Pseudomonas sp. TAD18]|nr:hypothetical protein AP060_00018 [Pseudomonas sp. TAD18]
MLSGVGQQILPDTGVLAGGDLQVVIALDLHFAVGRHGALVFGFQHADAVTRDGFFALAVDLHPAVMFDVLFKITLRVQVNQFLAFTVFDAQFVETCALRRAAAAEHALGFMRGQIQRHRVDAVGQAAGNNRPVRIAVYVVHQHFHAHSRDRHAAVTLTRPA